MRIFIGLCEIAGYYSNLAKGLRELGHEVTFVGANEHPFEYTKEQDPSIISLYYYVRSRRRQATNTNLTTKIFWAALEKLTIFVLFLWSLFNHDVFIFGYGLTFNKKAKDLAALKFFSKTTICNLAHGSEARPPYLDGPFIHHHYQQNLTQELQKLSRHTSEKINCIERYATHVIAAPLASHFLGKAFVSTYEIGVPVTTHSHEQPTFTKNIDAVRILHAPSHPVCKGSDIIKDIIDELKGEGHKIDYVEITGRPHAEVLTELAKCDFIVDQMYSDGALAGFATEAAWFKKPAIVGGYGWDIVEKYFPKGHLPLSHTCHPSELKSAILHMIEDDNYRKALGEKAYNFVHHHWSGENVAKRFELLLTNLQAPDDWYIKPQDIHYLHGCGIDETKLQSVLNDYISTLGAPALNLEDRPSLKEKILTFSGIV